MLRSRLTAAHGEALATDGQRNASLGAFDEAAALLPTDPVPEPGSPYVALDATHLNRWRGHALARFGHPDAITVLTDALAHHDATFVRAEAGLRADLTLAYLACGEQNEAAPHRDQAARLAPEVAPFGTAGGWPQKHDSLVQAGAPQAANKSVPQSVQSCAPHTSDAPHSAHWGR